MRSWSVLHKSKPEITPQTSVQSLWMCKRGKSALKSSIFFPWGGYPGSGVKEGGKVTARTVAFLYNLHQLHDQRLKVTGIGRFLGFPVHTAQAGLTLPAQHWDSGLSCKESRASPPFWLFVPGSGVPLGWCWGEAPWRKNLGCFGHIKACELVQNAGCVWLSPVLVHAWAAVRCDEACSCWGLYSVETSQIPHRVALSLAAGIGLQAASCWQGFWGIIISWILWNLRNNNIGG